jgi:hypothetical protein
MKHGFELQGFVMVKTWGWITVLLFVGSLWADPPDSWEEHRRAGFPQEVSRWAKPSDTGRYTGYTVGGGSLSLRKGSPPFAQEGTWGWDYVGGVFQRRVILNWWHGRRYQGGVGAYQTDGPRVLPAIEK